MRADYYDPVVRPAIYDLLDTSFSRLSERIAISDRLGAVWHEVSTAFVAFEDGLAVSHTGVIEIPMVIGGQPRTVAGIHAVCTRPGYRGRGLSTAVMREALEYADSRTDLAILTTSITGFYEPFGFRVVPENRFEIGWRGESWTDAPPARWLSSDDPDDVRLLYDLLSRRTHVSNVIASVDPGWLFIIDEVLNSRGFGRLYHVADLDAVVACQQTKRRLVLLDIVAPGPVHLDRVIPRMPERSDRVETMFTPDRVWYGQTTLLPGDPDDCLMVRGDISIATPCALSQLARC
jgi:predicted N-acetyltransferase YhbS